MRGKKIFAIITSLTMVVSLLSPVGTISAAMPEYEIYPKPQKTTYQENVFILRDEVNVVYENGIDKATKDRLNEVLELKKQVASISQQVVDAKENQKVTNIILGVYGSGEYVDQYVKEHGHISTQNLFDKTDSYYLSVDNNVITVLGKDADSAFYGLTSLYHVYKQLESKTIRNFVIEDWADVKSRGFIEGYYGNPWSVENRKDLMEWSGYYKLNSYFYAPKDDPKHNREWRELYSQEEINEKIKPLAEAGNSSKCRFVFALHPYMNNAIRYNSEENYQADLKVMQAKFEQVIEAGVRQIAILADDAGNVGGDNYIKTLNDMTEWLKEKQKTYPDLKLTLPFCTQEYMYNGEEYYSRFPENVQIVMTGGRIWGEVSQDFTNKFTNNAGRGPYLWINWPCTDNSKKHLIMGGYDTFLHPNVNPQNIQGIVLNPMQQSEPSKVAIFGNACYSWNIWDSKEDADKAWQNSFKYVDHNSAIETSASQALHELSKHMMNQSMDGRVTVLQESVDLKPKLDAFKENLKTNKVSTAQIDELIQEFEVLQKAAKTYREQAGNSKTKDQIVYWINCWDDTTTSAISYLNALKANLNNDSATLIAQYSAAQKAFSASKTYSFHYVDHLEIAEVGVQHIVPFIKALDTYLANKVNVVVNPDMITKTYISNRFNDPFDGAEDALFDENDSTSLEFRNPNVIKKDDYVGVSFNKGTTINSIRIAMDGGKNHFYNSKLQYTTDGKNWIDVDKIIYRRPKGSSDPIAVKGLNLENVKGIRLLVTQDNGDDAWLKIHSIDINKKQKIETSYSVENATVSNGIIVTDKTHVLKNAYDGDKTTEVWLKNTSGDNIPADATVTLDLGSTKTIGSVYIAQGSSVAGDVIDKGVIEYSNDNNTWKTFGNVKGDKEQTIIGESVAARYVRIRNTEMKNIWWRLAEFQVNTPTIDNTPISYNIIKTNRWEAVQGHSANLLTDGDDDTFVWYDPDGAGNTTEDDALVNDFLGLDLGKVAKLKSAHIVVGAEGGDKLTKYAIETSLTGGTDSSEWKAVKGYESYSGVASGKDVLNIQLNGTEAKYIRIRNLENAEHWVKFSEFTVKEIPTGETEHLYTNADTTLLTNVSETKDAATMTPGDITLDSQKYIGFKLDNIKELDTITLDISDSSIPLQVSQNGLIWKDVNAGEQTDNARYVRLINTKTTSINLTINEFKVTSKEIQPIHFHSSNIPPIPSWGDTRNNGAAFDENMGTKNKIGGNPRKNEYVIYDLGQMFDIHSLRTYVSDNEKDFIRDAKFQVSSDLNTWTDAFTIGDGVTDTDADSPVINSSVFKNVDSNYPNVLYEGNDSLKLTGRYIRILVTADFPTRAININEIIINGGAYKPVENNKDYVGALEEKGHQPGLMGDGDLTTTYKPTLASSSITYNVSEPDGIKSFRIIQNGEVSKADVVATFLSTSSRSTQSLETVKVGTLNQAVNDFVIPNNKKLINVSIQWKDTLPEVSEIILSKNSVDNIDKTLLENLLKQTSDSSWTKTSIEKFNKAKEIAQDIYDGKYYTQGSVDSAFGLLNTAINNAEKKADVQKLNDIVSGAIVNDKGYYSVLSYANYSEKLKAMKLALKDADNISEALALQLTNDLSHAKDNLTYAISFRETAKLSLLDDNTLAKENYSTVTYNKYSEVKEALNKLIIKDEEAKTQADRVTPKDLEDAVALFNKTQSELADILELNALISEFEKYDSSLYTPESFKVYETAINDAKELLTSGTKDTITAQKDVIKVAKNQLVVYDSTTLDGVIQDALKVNKDNYTLSSYEALNKLIKEAQALVNPTQDRINDYVQKLTNAKTRLVSIVALKERVAEAKRFDKDKYTISSYEKLTNALNSTTVVMKNGSEEDVRKAIDLLTKSIQSLELSGTQALKDYKETMKLKDKYYYTSDSYDHYLKAYQKMITLANTISLKEFQEVKNEFEKYEALLKLKEADYKKVQDIISKIPSDLSKYNAQKVQRLNDVLASIDYHKSIKDQAIVDQYAKDLNKALQAVLHSENGVQTSDDTTILFSITTVIIAGYVIYVLKKKKSNL